MAGFVVVASVANLSWPMRKLQARRIKRKLRRHEGLTRRSGVLSESAFVHVYDDEIWCGATASYASYLSEGTTRLKRSYPYIRNAVEDVLGAGSVLREGKLP